MSLRDNPLVCHSGTAQSAGPGIQPQARHFGLDSGLAPPGRPGMTDTDGGAA